MVGCLKAVHKLKKADLRDKGGDELLETLCFSLASACFDIGLLLLIFRVPFRLLVPSYPSVSLDPFPEKAVTAL